MVTCKSSQLGPEGVWAGEEDSASWTLSHLKPGKLWKGTKHLAFPGKPLSPGCQSEEMWRTGFSHLLSLLFLTNSVLALSLLLVSFFFSIKKIGVGEK